MNRPRAQRYWLAILALSGLIIASGLGAAVLTARAQPPGLTAAETPPTRAAGPTLVQLPSAPVNAAVTQPTMPPTVVVDNTPTATVTTAPTETPLPAATQTALYLASCVDDDQVQPDLLTVVDPAVALARDFEPADLADVPLESSNILYRSIPLRQVVHQPLLDMVEAMNEAGLAILVVSGYRSYSEQTLAYEKWQALYPDRTDISAAPGHSEHQLGTAVDFSTPYMDDLFGDFFNVRFSQTPEGEWLLEHAAAYGFTLSYPSGATDQTGYAWEPWHFRYVGDLALELTARSTTLTQYLRQCPPPS